jgi:hypothetical protein
MTVLMRNLRAKARHPFSLRPNKQKRVVTG